MAHLDVSEDKPPGSQNGTLEANRTHRPQSQNGSLEGPGNRKNRGRGVPVVTEDTAKVLEMYLKRHPPLSQGTSHDSSGSFASSEGSERPERPQPLAFRRTRAERAQRGSNNVIRLDTQTSTTPGHVRRDVETSFPVLPAALLADDLARDGGPDRGANGGGEGADRNVTDSWTESGDDVDIPFVQRNQAEREEYFKRIADRLAMIGDQVLADYTTETIVAEGPGVSLSECVEIGQQILTGVDGNDVKFASQADFLNSMAMDVIKKTTYQSFCSAIESVIGQDIGMWQLAIVFKFTKVAIGAADSMGKHASSIKDNSIRFISDRFAVWLASQGGWDSVVTSDDSDFAAQRTSDRLKDLTLILP